MRRADAAGASATARKALGFEELLRGDVDAMKRRTRNYAKRQLTWMRRLGVSACFDAQVGVCRIDPGGGLVKRLALLATMAACLCCRRSRIRRPRFLEHGAEHHPVGTVRRRAGAEATRTEQARMYDALTPLFDDVKTRDLDALLQVREARHQGPGPHEARARAAPRRAHLPRQAQRPAHLRQTNDDVTWGAGWALAARPRAAARAGALQRRASRWSTLRG